MALYCLASPGGSPGVTTTALGLALAWPHRVLLAECDPMGRRVLTGYMADRLDTPAGPGLLGLAMSSPASGAAVPLEEHVLPVLKDGHVDLLHGLRDPRHAPHLADLWERLAPELVARDGDVLADLGRLGGQESPVELLQAAQVIVMVLRPTLAQVDAARPRVEALKALASERAHLRLCLIADGPYGTSEVERALGVPALTRLPYSPPDAKVLSDGARHRRTFHNSLLVRALNRLGRRLRKTLDESTVQATAHKSASPTPTPTLTVTGSRR